MCYAWNLHEGLRPPQGTSAQTASFGPAAHNAALGASPTPSAAGNMAAVELCTLLLTDQEVLDVVLALHDIRTAQLCHLLPWSGSHALKLPPPSEALAKQLSQSQRSVPGSQLLPFVTALEGDPLLRVWDSMHRAMLLVLAALQSLPIRPHPQHPDPAATTHTFTTPQLPPGYMRCTACLFISLRLALRLSRHHMDTTLSQDPGQARLHATLPGLLLGLSTAVTVMEAAGQCEADAHRLLLVRCILHLGATQLASWPHLYCGNVAEELWRTYTPTTSCPDHLAHLLASGPAVTGWPGPLPAKPMDSNSTAAGKSSGGGITGPKVDPASWNTYVHLAQALCAVLWRQDEGFDVDLLLSAAYNQGRSRETELQRDVTGFVKLTMVMVGREKSVATYVAWLFTRLAPPSRVLDASDRFTAGTTAGADPSDLSDDIGISRLVSIVLSILPRCLLVYQAGVGALWLAANTCIRADCDLVPLQDLLTALFADVHCLHHLGAAMVLALMQRLPDWRRRPVMLRVVARTATAAVLEHKALALIFIDEQDVKAKAATQDETQQMSQPAGACYETLLIATDMWKKLLALCGSEDPMVRALRAFAAPWVKDGGGSVLEEVMAQDGIVFYTAADEPAADPAQQPLSPPSPQQLSPVALDLVRGMDGMLEMMEKQQKMAQHMVDLRGGLRRFVGGYCGVLALCGHTIDVLGDPSVVGPDGLAAQPASWLPCGNSLVEGWCTRLSAWICKLFCSLPPTRTASQSLPYTFNFLLCQGLADSHRLLVRGQQHPPPRMSHRAQRSLSCLTMVLTAAVPLHGWLCIVHRLRVSGEKLKSHKTWCLEPMREALAQLEPELVWTWRALAASSSVESVLARILRDAARETQLSHLCAPPPKGWQASLGWSMQSSESLVPGLKLCLARLKQPVHS